jgi:hypothetical protein
MGVVSPGRFTSGERALNILGIGGLVGRRTGLDALEKIKHFKINS